MTYDELLEEAYTNGVTVKELPLLDSDGRCSGKRIAIRKGITEIKKKCTLAEEIGHYKLTVGNIHDQSKCENRKQEHKARVWSYNKLVGLNGIIQAHKHKCRSLYDMAEYLGVTEDFLNETLGYYSQHYGEYVAIDNYIIYFAPYFGVMEAWN